MRIEALEFRNIKSFEGTHRIDFNIDSKMFAFSGKNGAGKSTVLKLLWLVQKGHFISTDPLMMSGISPRPEYVSEVLKYLTSPDSYAELQIDVDGTSTKVRILRKGHGYDIQHTDYALLRQRWDIASPNNLILYVDASKGFSEETLKFDELNIAENDKRFILQQALYAPGLLFTGLYQQLVKDHVHDRLLPSKPERLLYYQVARNIFTRLIPEVELRNFSGNHKPGEFVLLGRAGKGRAKPTPYDVRDFSSGEKALLSTLAFLCISKTVITLVIDEPENHFHESLLLEFMSVLSRLTEKGGIHTWLTENPGTGKKIKMDWVQNEYQGHSLEQVLVSTHSKSLIYKFFTMGKNFAVAEKIKPLAYEDAESKLRQLGLSTIYSRVLLVEGDNDHAALELLLKGKNVKIKPLDGSSAVVDTFRRLAEVREHVSDARFVFLVDSDNKPPAFLQELEAINRVFFKDSFVSLDVHEFENLFLDASLFKQVLDGIAGIVGGSSSPYTEAAIQAELVTLAKLSLPQVFKKEISLSMQHAVERHFAKLIWGNKNFKWDSEAVIQSQLSSSLTAASSATLSAELAQHSKSTFDTYAVIDDLSLLARCDGKQVLGRACGKFASTSGVTSKYLMSAIVSAGASLKGGKAQKVATAILERFNES